MSNICDDGNKCTYLNLSLVDFREQVELGNEKDKALGIRSLVSDLLSMPDMPPVHPSTQRGN